MKHYWISAIALFAAFSTQADDLLQVYHQALNSDPIFAQAESTWHSQQMNLPIARASYLPQLGMTGSAVRDYSTVSPSYYQFGPSYSWEYAYGLTLTQPIFNYAAWSQIKGADATVKSATATYFAAQQSLMQRVAQAYFAVLQAYDQLRYTIANKRAVWEQYLTAREQFRVGLIAITDEYDARSKYDQVVAQQISAQNNLNVQIENLRAITGQSYPSLKGLGKHLPLLAPVPNNMRQWVNIAEKQNYGLQAQNYSVIAAMDTIKQEAAGGYPTLSLTGTGTQTRQDAQSGSAQPSVITSQVDLGLQLAYNPIQGGLVRASTEQARYNYKTAVGLLEQTHRGVIDDTRTSFLGVLSYANQVKADEQSIISAKKAVAATEAGFKVGTRTMVDVLLDLTALYQSQQQHANDEYSYINNLIALKAAAGTLSLEDLKHINAWLQGEIHFPDQIAGTEIPKENNHEIIFPGEANKNKSVKHKRTRSKHSQKKAQATTLVKSLSLPVPR